VSAALIAVAIAAAPLLAGAIGWLLEGGERD